MSQPAFVHLRLHSEYSVADGIVRLDIEVKKLDAEGNSFKEHVCPPVAAARADGMPALALTDLNNVFGMVKFYKAARGAGIKPLIGADVFISNEADRNQPHRLLLLCQSNAGYLRLCRLLTRGFLENQHLGRAELRRDFFDAGTEGLIALSGAQLGDVGTALLNGDASGARQLAQFWAERFPDRYYLEIQRCGFPREEIQVQGAAQLAAELDLPLVATHPVQFMAQDDFKAHEARVCIAEGYVLNDKRRAKAFTDQQYFKTQAEMAALFADLPLALENSVEIAKRCNLTLKLGQPQLPDFPTPNGESLNDFLRSEAERGLAGRMLTLFPDEHERSLRWPEYSERLAFETNTIIQMGFPGYFLIVADFIRWAKAFRDPRFPNGVPVGPGRGSGAGSLVAYSLGITDLDPLRYDLLFERFLNPERVSMPDFDVDFCQDGRELVIRYVRDHYGAACVSQIATFGTMASKGVIRDVGRVMDFPYGLCDRLSKLIPLEGVKPVSLRKARELEPEINALANDEEGVPELLELAERLEDLTRNIGMHAGGVLIAPGQLTDFCPLYTSDGSNPVSQLDKDDVEAIGLVKFDFLGLRTLTIIDWAVRYVNRLAGGGAEPFCIDTIPLDDQPTYERVFKNANTTAVFQFESRGMKDTLINAKPDCLEDLIALNALYRPGPMDYIPDFINRKHGRETVVYPHPCLEKILKPTYGIMVYQEQVMQAAQVAAGYSLGGADMLRRAMGKKKADEMAKERAKFVTGAEQNGIGEAQANEIFDTMEKFAGYGFNKSHAAAYSLVAYQTAYLKCHHPAAFMASTMTSEMDNTDKVSFFYQDTLQQGLTILPPDVNSSDYRFAPLDAKTIVYGLGAIKGTGQAAIENIVAARQSGAFRDLFDFCRRVDKRVVNRRTIEALIRGGAFDTLSDHRHQLMATLDLALEVADQHARHANQNNLFDGDEDELPPLQLAEVARWGLREQLMQEKTALGFYLSGHPFQEYAPELARFVKLKLAEVTPQLLQNAGRSHYSEGGGRRNSGTPVLLAGMVAGVRLQQTRSGRIAIILLDDGSAQLELVVSNEVFDASRQWIREDELLVVQGRARFDDYSNGMRVSGDEVFNLATARAQFARRLDVRVTADCALPVSQLKTVLEPWSRGRCPVVIHYRNRQACAALKLGEAWAVTPDDALLADLRARLGEEAVRVNYGKEG